MWVILSGGNWLISLIYFQGNHTKNSPFLCFEMIYGHSWLMQWGQPCLTMSYWASVSEDFIQREAVKLLWFPPSSTGPVMCSSAHSLFPRFAVLNYHLYHRQLQTGMENVPSCSCLLISSFRLSDAHHLCFMQFEHTRPTFLCRFLYIHC